MSKTKLMQYGVGLACVALYIAAKALNVELPPVVHMFLEAVLAGGAGALLIPRPSDTAAIRGEED